MPEQQTIPSSTVAEAGSTIIRETALGVVLVVVLVLFWLFAKQFIAAQNARVTDLEKANDRSKESDAAYRKALEENTTALSAMAASQSETAKAIDRLTRAVDDNTRSQDWIVREVVGVRRRTPSTGTMAAVVPVREDPRREREG